MDKLFLDANILFSAAYRSNAGLLRLWEFEVELFSSSYAIEEVRRNLSDHDQRYRLEQLVDSIKIIKQEQTSIVLDKAIVLRDKDRPILQAAIFAKVNYLITGDFRDFGIYFGKTIQNVTILPPADYFKKHQSGYATCTQKKD
jgi:predicted nucleic acid-binding protein